MQLRVGWSTARGAHAAAVEAVGRASGGEGECALALAFCTDGYDPGTLARALSGELGNVPWVGCTTAGVIAGTQLLREGVAVAMLWAEGARVGVGVAGPVSRAPREAGRSAVAQALEGMGLIREDRCRAIILLPDATSGMGSEVVRGAAQEAGTGLCWAGGGVGDNLQLVRAAELAAGEAYEDAAVALAVETQEPIGVGIRHGWRPYGPATMVTRATGSSLWELDYDSAFSVYRAVAATHGHVVSGDAFTEFAMLHPLGIPQTFGHGQHLIRDPVAVGSAGELQCVAEVPEGTLVRLMSGEREGLLEAGRGAAEDALGGISNARGGGVLFGCFSRYRGLGLEGGQDEELVTVAAALSRRSFSLVGCLTLGEVGAMRGGMPQFHNKTAVVMAF